LPEDEQNEEKVKVNITRRIREHQPQLDETSRTFVVTFYSTPDSFGRVVIPDDEWSEDEELKRIREQVRGRRAESVSKTVEV